MRPRAHINVAASQPGTYTVTSTVAASGGCAAAAGTATVTLAAPANAAFAYASSTYCLTGANSSPTITGTTGGTFSVARVLV